MQIVTWQTLQAIWPERYLAVMAFVLAGTLAANAQIENQARGVGSHSRGADTVSPVTEQTVPVVPAAPALDLTVSATLAEQQEEPEEGEAADNDTRMTIRYTLANSGNVTLTDITAAHDLPMFQGQAGTGTLSELRLVEGPQALAPGQTASFEAEYRFALIDQLQAVGVEEAITLSASASGVYRDRVVETVVRNIDSGISIAPAPALQLEKTALLNDEINADGQAAAGETITYTYQLYNSGNVALNDVTVVDIHEGDQLAPDANWNETLVSDGPLADSGAGVISDDSGADGIWDILQPGATISFTYVHTVTQDEIDNQ
jgi:hypothetical protein